MPLSNVVRKDKQAQYRRTDDMERAQRGVAAAVHNLLQLPELQLHEKRGLLTIALWKWTEAAGVAPNAKYNLRYASEGALKQDSEPRSVHHEHVFTRRSIIDELLGHGLETKETVFDFLTQRGVACVVTTTEHALLCDERRQGWDRYRHAGVRVWDFEQAAFRDTYTDAEPAVADGTPLEAARLDSLDDSPDPQPNADDAEQDELSGGPAYGNGSDVELALTHYAGSNAALLRRLLRTLSFADTVAVVAVPKSATAAPRYVRIHDTRMEEPTRTVAWVHWNGKVSLGLQPDDVPEHLREHVTPQNHATYGLACRVEDERSLEVAEDLVLVALQKLRGQYDID